MAAYMTGNGYVNDFALVAQKPYVYASSYNTSVDGSSKHAWVFDIDETSLSNLPYYEVHNFGYVSHSQSSHANPLI